MNKARDRLFQAGDIVTHCPTGERWMLGCDERHGLVFPRAANVECAPANECEFWRRVQGRERLATLTDSAGSDWLHAYMAREDLERSRAYRSTRDKTQRRNSVIRLVARVILATVGAMVIFAIWGLCS